MGVHLFHLGWESRSKSRYRRTGSSRFRRSTDPGSRGRTLRIRNRSRILKEVFFFNRTNQNGSYQKKSATTLLWRVPLRGIKPYDLKIEGGAFDRMEKAMAKSTQ